MKKILLINAEGVQTVCLARSLRKNGHYVIGLCNNKLSPGYVTRWLSERHKCPDITINQNQFKLYLCDYLKENRVDLIIPLIDDGAEFLSRNKEIIEKTYNVKCAIPSYATFNIANDKNLLMQLCDQYNVNHPITRYITLENLEKSAFEVGFPSMIKPNLSQGAKGITRVNSLSELTEKYPQIHKQFGECTLQQYVDQPDYYYNVMLYRDKQGRMDFYTIIKIRRFFPIKGGSSCYSETIEHPLLLKQCKIVLEKLNWHGFADFDVLEDRISHELKIIEINPRVPSSLQASFAAGLDFGQIIVADAFDESIPYFVYKTGQQIRWLGLDVMWFVFSRDRFNFKPSWFRFFGKNVSYHDGSWNDPLPMIVGCLAGFIKYLNPEFRRSKLEG